ncbi:MAG: hypothetical protein A2Y97_02010 [Nitrospirae bacterium RBG_13_39_12]|nr:MAG: hypothetical protein A2Y97_02010 [Nitrospirae bacterium RBG_13_39_12]
MKHFMCNKKLFMFHIHKMFIFLKIFIVMIAGVLLIISLALASQIDLISPDLEFLNNSLAIKTETGISNLSIRLSEFLMGIQTDKTWERRSNALWILKTSFKDPVIDEYRTYSMEFERMDSLIILTKVSFDNHIFSRAETESFAKQIIQNFGKHISPK